MRKKEIWVRHFTLKLTRSPSKKATIYESMIKRPQLKYFEYAWYNIHQLHSEKILDNFRNSKIKPECEKENYNIILQRL